MNISVIFTGGTIGCKAKNGFLSTDESTGYALLDGFDAKSAGVEFSVSRPYSVLSENLSANELNILQKELAEILRGGCDGVIVTHGTDSLLYTAAALEYAFDGCDVPVVLVSAAYPLDDERTNGHINFEAAVNFIKSKAGNGVYVSYKNDGEQGVNIHTATHILTHGECSADLYSVTGKPFAVYENGKITVNYSYSAGGSALGTVEYSDFSEILVIESRPGDSFGYSLDDVKAVVLRPYHSATLNTASSSFEGFCQKAAEKNIPVFLVNSREGLTYESTGLFSSLGIKALPYGTYVSAYMKIWAAVSLGEDVTEFCKNRIAREIIS